MSGEVGTYPRFSLGQRAQHGILVVSFTVLALSGLPQKFASSRAGEAVIVLFGGIEAIRVVHRVAAFVLIVATLWHLLDVAYRVIVRVSPLSMWPRVQDLRDAARTLLYNLGRAESRPRSGRYSFEEKVEYWALLWGNVVMIVTGFMLWNPIASARILPGQFIPAAQVAHGSEALLAVLAVVIWHGYGVHVRHFNRSMLTGSLTEPEMREEHPLELEEIQSGRVSPHRDSARERRRRRIFVPVAATLAIALLGLLCQFVTFEETALPTIPRGAGRR